jgi:MoaA/NifB/PqqE/SkfB family radical SAM enzyme
LNSDGVRTNPSTQHYSHENLLDASIIHVWFSSVTVLLKMWQWKKKKKFSYTRFININKVADNLVIIIIFRKYDFSCSKQLSSMKL